MLVGVASETDPGKSALSETRVALTPETTKKLKDLGAEVVVEKGAGLASGIADSEYEKAGARLAQDTPEALADADVVFSVRRPSKEHLEHLKSGAIVLAIMDPYGHEAEFQDFAQKDIISFAMELMPRITRAQSMDVLSSQANLAGYRAVIDAAAEFGRAFPLMMTAAGTVPAARAFIMGVGVAGLQAIATAHRLGAQVSATDVRPATKEQVTSLGAKFVAVEDEEFKQAETSGGYARQMSSVYIAKQAALVADHITRQDIVITTALIPGKAAPCLVSADMVRSMRPGSILVDLAVERGGNIEESRIGETVEINGVKIIGWSSPLRLAATASSLYARNLLAFFTTVIDKETRQLAIDWDDELVKATCLTRDGKVVHSIFQPATA